MTTLTRPGGFARQRIDTAVHAVANEETRAASRASWSSTQQHCGPGGQIRTGREWNARVNAGTVTDGHDYKEPRHGHADMTTAPPSCGPDSTCRECSEQRTPAACLPKHTHIGIAVVFCGPSTVPIAERPADVYGDLSIRAANHRKGSCFGPDRPGQRSPPTRGGAPSQ